MWPLFGPLLVGCQTYWLDLFCEEAACLRGGGFLPPDEWMDGCTFNGRHLSCWHVEIMAVGGVVSK